MATVSLTREPALPDEPKPDGAQNVIDLRRSSTAGHTRVRIARHENPYEHLPPDERVKVIIRVLCGLVAYDEDDDTVDLDQPEAAVPVSPPASVPDPSTV